MKWLIWFRNRALSEALSGSAERLEKTRAMEKDMQEKTDKLRRTIARNHFEPAILSVFKVANGK